jgi:hypothetical protein
VADLAKTSLNRAAGGITDASYKRIIVPSENAAEAAMTSEK